MPSESLLLAVTSGLGVGIFAGIVSGVCYIVVTGFTSRRPYKSSASKWHCNICGVHFQSIENLLESGRVVSCIKCSTNICRARCSKLIKDVDHQKAGWVCQNCQNPQSWFKGILRTLQPNLEGERTSRPKMEPDKIDETEEDLDALQKREKQHVRGFIERLVEAMLGNSIDSANVTRMYKDPKYLPVLGQSPCSAHASLKLLIQRIIQEAIGLPTLENNDARIEMSNGDVNRTYEDLLATAILNKVVENYQDELSSSKANSISSRISNPSFCRNDKEYFFGGDTLDSKWRNGICTPAELDAASVSSIEDWVRSDSSAGSTKYVDPVSLKIQQRIEEASSSTDDEAKVRPDVQEALIVPESEWQQNWHMQKRTFGRNASPVPVPMLVPNPSTEAKVLIGDRDADDTTDLSDAGSDFGEAESSHSIEHILTSSKKIIGGKNKLESQTIKQQLNFELDGDKQNDVEIGKEDNSYMSFDSQTEQDTEYTERYATLPRTILKSPTPNSEPENPQDILLPTVECTGEPDDETDGDVQIEAITKQNGFHEIEQLSDGDSDTIEIFKGNYSQREKEKWNNAVEMKNNPYSSENLKRRLSGHSANNISSLFSKDYQIRESITSASTKNTQASSEDLTVNKVPVQDGQDHKFTSSEDRVYKAKPAFIIEPENDIEITSPIASSTMDISSDSDLSVERIYNLPSGNIYLNGKSEYLPNVDCTYPFIIQSESTTRSDQESIEKSMFFSLEYSTDCNSLENNTNSENSTIPTDPEITNLCDKHLVKDILGRFSKSYPNLTSQMKKDSECGSYKQETLPSTKIDATKQVYSLTARSIPKEFREELKRKEETPRSSSSSAILIEVQAADMTQFPVAKSKIRFFESLKP